MQIKRQKQPFAPVHKRVSQVVLLGVIYWFNPSTLSRCAQNNSSLTPSFSISQTNTLLTPILHPLLLFPSCSYLTSSKTFHSYTRRNPFTFPSDMTKTRRNRDGEGEKKEKKESGNKETSVVPDLFPTGALPPLLSFLQGCCP